MQRRRVAEIGQDGMGSDDRRQFVIRSQNCAAKNRAKKILPGWKRRWTRWRHGARKVEIFRLVIRQAVKLSVPIQVNRLDARIQRRMRGHRAKKRIGQAAGKKQVARVGGVRRLHE